MPIITTMIMMCDNQFFHDFPRLAKESGFYFYYRSKKIDWSHIDDIELEDIIKNKRFEKLEDKLEFIVNCDLDEDITKVLDSNFVKLFRLSQLSVSYLRHCQFYLDRCVILLQEQLSAALKEVENSRDIINVQNPFKCKECEKSFMTASYLESHERRRHLDRSIEKKLVTLACQTEEEERPVRRNVSQQTDDITTTSSQSQTQSISTHDVSVMTESDPRPSEINFMMERFENLYQRIEAIEKEAKSKSEVCVVEKPSDHFDLSAIFQRLLPMLQQYKPLHTAVDEALEPENKDQPLIDLDAESNQILKQVQNHSLAHHRNQNQNLDDSDEVIEIDAPKALIVSPTVTESTTRKRRKINTALEEMQETRQPLPRPRTSTMVKQKSLLLDLDDSDIDEQQSSPHIELKHIENDKIEFQTEAFQIEAAALPMPIEPLNERNAESIDQQIDTFTVKNSRQSDMREQRQTSSFKNFVKKNSPKFKGLRKTIKSSLSNWGDSKVFNNDRKMKKNGFGHEKLNQRLSDGESVLEEPISHLTESNHEGNILTKKLRELGIDPEWSGLPDNSYSRIKSILDQRRQIMEKKNPEYYQKRNILESQIMRKIQGDSEESTEVHARSIAQSPEKAKMYDIENETDSENSSPKQNIHNSLNLSSRSLDFNSTIPCLKALEAPPSVNNNVVVEIQTGFPATDSSESSAVNETPLRFKSSILSKGKDEPKKRVVFADNFEMETSHDLFSKQESISSTSSSDWDIPMP